MLEISKAIQVLGELEEVMNRKGEAFRSRAYQRASQSLMKHDTKEISLDILKSESGIGNTIYTKLCEYHETGKIAALEREKKTPLFHFTNVYGIGPKKAKELIVMGITTIKQLKERADLLNDKQKIGILYYDDLQKRIPRQEIKQYEDTFKKILSSYEFKIVGSYRRGAETSGDIDVIVKNVILEPLITKLVELNIIVEILSLGKHKCLCICKLNNGPNCRVDFLTTSVEEYPFALLYFTGSKVFNTIMRGRALSLGYTMNEHGITTKEKAKVNHTFHSEEEIFDFLGIEYRGPIDRVDIRNYRLTYTPEYQHFKENGVSVLANYAKQTLQGMLEYCEDLYHNGIPSPLSDDLYDMLREYTTTKYPTIQSSVGAIVKRDKITLPYPMASMDKIKLDTNELNKWKSQYKGEYDLSCKLDGVSALFYNESTEPKLYTRGNGIEGQDISHLIPYLKLPLKTLCTIRGEIIISKQTFDLKYKKESSNARNLVSGWVNRKTASPEKWHDLSFVAYEMVYPKMSPISQKQIMNEMPMECVRSFKTKGLDNSLLSKLLLEIRKSYKYEIDGIIVRQDVYVEPTIKNPKNAFAFKMVLADQMVETKVLGVEWNPSKDGYLKPTIIVETITIGGVTIQRATGFNGKFIQDNGIGPGAIIMIIRSGDVIPHVNKVIKSVSPQMPKVSYEWTSTGVDIVLEHANKDKDVIGKQLLAFFQGMDVDGIGPGTIVRFVNKGYDTIEKILAMSIEDIKELEGFQEKSSKKVYNSIHERISQVPLARLLGKTNIFGRGFGEKRIQYILDKYPRIFAEPLSSNHRENIISISGFSDKTADSFVNNIHLVRPFLDTLNRPYIDNTITITEQHVLSGKKVAFSGIRDKSLCQELANRGIIVVEQVSKDTSILIVKDKDDITSKVEKAIKYEIPIVLIDDFKL